MLWSSSVAILQAKEEIDARCAALVHSFNLYRKGKTS